MDGLPHALDLIWNDNDSNVKTVHHKLQSSGCGGHCGRASNDSIPIVNDNNGVAHRPRVSPFPMITVEEAQNIVLNEGAAAAKCNLQVLVVANYAEALGKILAEDIVSVDPLPPFPASIKDGYVCDNIKGKRRSRILFIILFPINISAK